MKAVLLGLDYLDLPNGLKFLEINTDTYIPDTSYSSFDFDALETHLVSAGYTKFRLIYKSEHTTPIFVEKLETICTNNSITFEPVTVSYDSITIPSFDDSASDFTLRLSYDITAIIDDTYARDKKELLSLIFNGNQTDLIPKTYFKKDEETFDNLSNLIDNGNNPNVIVKKSLPDAEKKQYPKFNKLSTEEELTTIKSELGVDFIAQEFQYNATTLYNNKINDHIRYWVILCSDVETIIDFGGYKSPNSLPLEEEYISYTNETLNEDSRILYFSNPNRIGKGIPSTYEITKIDGDTETIVTIDQLELGDVVKSISIPGLSDATNMQDILNWNHTGSIADITYTTASVTVTLSEEVDEWFIKVNYTLDSTEHHMLVNLVELVLTSDADGTNLTFKAANELVSGNHIVISNTIVGEVSSIEYEKYVGNAIRLNIDPDDVFVAGTDLNGINQTIASSFIIFNYKQ
jgi:hypothetical protein